MPFQSFPESPRPLYRPIESKKDGRGAALEWGLCPGMGKVARTLVAPKPVLLSAPQRFPPRGSRKGVAGRSALKQMERPDVYEAPRSGFVPQ